MKIFRRLLLLILVASMFGSLFWVAFLIPSSGDFFSVAIGLVLGVQLWSIIFLKVEPNLTRIALMLILIFTTLVIWLATGMMNL